MLLAGNEQYNKDFPAQVAAMEAKAKALGRGNTLTYMNVRKPPTVPQCYPNHAANLPRSTSRSPITASG